MIHLILADCEIELVPREIAEHPLIARRARRRGKGAEGLLLDSNFDHRAMRRLPEGNRRGRPDIAHVCLLNALDSIPSRDGEMRTYLHTRDDIVMRIAPETRIPRSQNRFYGLMESIISRERGTDLIGFERMDLRTLVEGLKPDTVIAFSPQGETVDLGSVMKEGREIAAIVGGFPRGEFRSPVSELADSLVSIYGTSLDAWTVVGEIICRYRTRGE